MNLENQAVEKYNWTDLLPLSKSMTVPQANPKFYRKLGYCSLNLENKAVE